jgi:radical SAM-linked protein
MILRIKFGKHGAVRYIGHLDVMRFFQKAIRRAEIDVAYTKGYSPHQIMSFAQPLSVGLESNGEYMDIEVNSIISCEDVKVRLNEASVPGIEILSVKLLPENAGNAMASVAAALYTVEFKEGRLPALFSSDRAEDALNTFMSKDEIIITKEGKAGQRNVNIRQGIYRFDIHALGTNDCYCTMLLDASSAGNVKPIQVITALLSDNGEELTENALLVTREDTFTRIEDKLVSMDDIGSEKMEGI